MSIPRVLQITAFDQLPDQQLWDRIAKPEALPLSQIVDHCREVDVHASPGILGARRDNSARDRVLRQSDIHSTILAVPLERELYLLVERMAADCKDEVVAAVQTCSSRSTHSPISLYR